jgi:hypothetical protein
LVQVRSVIVEPNPRSDVPWIEVYDLSYSYHNKEARRNGAVHGADGKGTRRPVGILVLFRRGEVAEWSIAAVSKTVEPLRVPEVRILSSPPFLCKFTGRRNPGSPSAPRKNRLPPPCRDDDRRAAWWCRLPRSPVASESAARYSDRRTRET